MFQESQAQLMTWSSMGGATWNMINIWLTFWKSVGRIHWPWIQTRCSSDFPKFHSLDTSGVPRGSVQIQRKLQQWKGWIYPEIWRWWEVSLGLVNYLNRFSLCLAELSEPLRDICRQDMEFELNWICTCCFFKDKRGNIQECHTSIFQSWETYHSANRCFQKRTWSSYSTRFQASHVCVKGIDWGWEELPKPGEGVLSDDLGDGEISLLSLWQTVYSWDQPETTSLHI